MNDNGYVYLFYLNLFFAYYFIYVYIIFLINLFQRTMDGFNDVEHKELDT